MKLKISAEDLELDARDAVDVLDALVLSGALVGYTLEIAETDLTKRSTVVARLTHYEIMPDWKEPRVSHDWSNPPEDG